MVPADTHRDLEARVQEGLFREDLFYRLAVVPIQLSPLRERTEDIEDLCQMLCARIARGMKVPSKQLSQGALLELQDYAFPGKIRELANLLERALILGRDLGLQADNSPLQPGVAPSKSSGAELTIEQLAAQLPEQLDLREMRAKLERVLIERAINSSGGVQAEAARRLGLSRIDVGYKVGKYSL
jgi:transcriptional regulator with GAF, ATPase, and Fis domain